MSRYCRCGQVWASVNDVSQKAVNDGSAGGCWTHMTPKAMQSNQMPCLPSGLGNFTEPGGLTESNYAVCTKSATCTERGALLSPKVSYRCKFTALPSCTTHAHTYSGNASPLCAPCLRLPSPVAVLGWTQVGAAMQLFVCQPPSHLACPCVCLDLSAVLG